MLDFSSLSDCLYAGFKYGLIETYLRSLDRLKAKKAKISGDTGNRTPDIYHAKVALYH